MNPKQSIPVIARVAPPLLLVVLAGLAIKSLFTSDERKPEAKPAKEVPKTPLVVPIIPPISIPAVSEIRKTASVSTVPISEDFPKIPQPRKRRIVLREDLARVFQNGARSLYRINAVAELQKLGLGKTAAYEAVSPNGRFASWLRIAPDGIISWKSP